jgi:predicted TPR repeat methyltransferase
MSGDAKEVEDAVTDGGEGRMATERVEITIEQAIEIAISLMKEGRFRDADALCRALLELEPDHPDALHYAGMLAHQRGSETEALALIKRSLERVPDQPDWYSNLGIVLQSNGQFEAAMEAYSRAIALNEAHQNAHNNLGVLQRLHGQLEDAEASFRTVIALNPDHQDVYLNLAVVLDQTGRVQDALTAYCKAITLRPSHPQAHRHLAIAYAEIGETQKAIEVCEEWVRNNPHDPRARHALAAHSGRDVPARASDAYVEKVFDDFADSFEAKLARLEYKAPALVADVVAAVMPAPEKRLDVLDAGCGTGLCGPRLAPFARRLIGVDLSRGMLKLAGEKQVYDELVHAELTEYLTQHPNQFDVIVTADTLVYFGALEAVAAAASAALRPGGLLVFTVEEATEPEFAASHRLRPHGRYTHGADYVERVLAGAGLTPHIDRADLRLESGIPVSGLVVRAAKPTGAPHA